MIKFIQLSIACQIATKAQIHKSSKTGISLNILPKKGLTAKSVKQMQMINGSDLPGVSTQPHSKDETKEDKRARKQAIKRSTRNEG